MGKNPKGMVLTSLNEGVDIDELVGSMQSDELENLFKDVGDTIYENNVIEEIR